MKPNRLKAKLAAGRGALGCSVMFPSPQMVEMLGHAGFDWVLLDCEHGSIGPGDVELMCMAADAVGITPIGRPTIEYRNRHHRADGSRRDGRSGAARQYRRRCPASRFSGQVRTWRRSWPGCRHAAGSLGARREDGGFRHEANAQSLVCVQIEHEAALPNVDEILKVDGIDVFFIGPSDLSQSMGYPGNPKAPPVAEAIATTLAKIRAAGKTPGMPATAETLPGVLADGCRYIYNHVPKLLGAGAAAFMKASG